MTEIYTSTFGDYWGADRLDITSIAKSLFSPPWDLVKRYKSGEIDDEKYKIEYTALMRTSYKHNTHLWKKHLEAKRITLVCHCKPGAFCHRVLLAKILEKVGSRYGGARYIGEIDAG